MITGWHIEGYGVFAGYEIQGLGPGLTVAYGPNEAGKSTLLDFIRFVLFGHSRNDPKREPLRGGRHGGRLYVTDSGGCGWTIERHATGRGRLSVTRQDGVRGSAEDLSHLTGGMDAGSFRSIFAFSLYELSEFDTLSSTGVRDRIFSSGITGAGAAAGEARRQFEKRAGELLKPRTGRAKINELLEELRSVSQRLREARVRAADYPAALQREEDAGEQVAALDQQAEQLAERIRRLALLVELWEPYNRWAAADRRLREMAERHLTPELHSELPAEMRDLRVAAAGAREQHAELARRSEELARERKALRERPEIVALGGAIRQLAAELALYDSRVQRRGQLRSELIEFERELQVQLARIGEGWKAEALPGLQLPVTTADELLGWEQRLDTCRRQAEIAAAAAEDARRRVRVLGERAERTRGERREVLEGPDPGEVAELRDRLAAMETASGRLSRLRLGLSAALGMAAVLGAGGLWCLLAGRAGWSYPLFAAAAVALLGSASAARSTAREKSSFTEHAAALGLGRSPGPESAVLAGGRRVLREAEEQARQKGEAGEEVRSAEREVERAELELRELTAAAGRADEALAAAVARWEQWKARAGLPVQLSAHGIRDLLASLGRARDTQAALRRARDELRRTEDEIQAWEEKARRLAAEAGETCGAGASGATGTPVASGPEDLRAAAAALSSTLDEALETARQARQLDARLEEAGRDLASAAARLSALDARRRAILEAAGVEDDAGFDRKVQEAEEHATCRIEVDESWAVIEARLGRGEYADRLREALEGGDPESWEVELATVSERLEQVKTERDGAVEQRRDARRDREELEVSADVPSLSAREGALIDEIGRAVAEWRTMRLAGMLIDRALESYVRERQPEVLQVASGVLSRITGGRYLTVLQETGGDGLAVLDDSGRRRSPEELSRGTLEQLYLAMRLGLAESLAGRATPLPLVMDDVLVNFDPQRARRLVESLADYLRDGRRQILLFTCHPETRDLVGSVAPAATVVELGWTVPEAGREVAASRATPGNPPAGRT